MVWGGEDQLCGWRSKLKFWEFRVSGPDLGDFGFLVLIWGIYVVVMVTCEIKGRETHVAWVMSATVDF